MENQVRIYLASVGEVKMPAADARGLLRKCKCEPFDGSYKVIIPVHTGLRVYRFATRAQKDLLRKKYCTLEKA